PHAEQVDRQRALHVLDGAVGKRAREGDAGVRDRHVDPAEALHGGTHGALQRIEVGYIRLKARSAVAEARGVLLQALRLEADERHVRAAPMPRAAPVMNTVRPAMS